MKFFEDFALTDQEWNRLEKQYGLLLNTQAWQLLRMNSKGSHTDDFEDILQTQKIAMYRSACYYKRQTYIESCLEIANEYAKNPLVLSLVEELENLWNNKTRHGAGKIKYGDYQQALLDNIVRIYVPDKDRPDKKRPLQIDSASAPYFKSCTWNSKKNLGKKITREKTWRSGLVSLSEHGHLGVVA